MRIIHTTENGKEVTILKKGEVEVEGCGNTKVEANKEAKKKLLGFVTELINELSEMDEYEM